MAASAPDDNWTVELESAWQSKEIAPHTTLQLIEELHEQIPEHSPDYARLLVVESACHWRYYRFDQMMDLLVEAFVNINGEADPLWLARLHGRISAGLTSAGDMTSAYKHARLQLAAATACIDGPEKNGELFTVFHNLGRHFFVRKDYKRAERYYKRCYRHLPVDKIANVLLLQNHAETLARLGELKQATDQVERALALGRQNPPNRSVVYALGVKAWILTTQNRTQEAEDALLHAIEYATDSHLASAQPRMKLAELHLADNDHAAALLDLTPVEQLINVQGDQHDRVWYHKLMSQVHEAAGSYESSLLHFKKFYDTQLSVNATEKQNRNAAEKLIDDLERIRRQSIHLKRENYLLKDAVNRYKSLHAEARELSERDSLTGLYNRRMLESLADDIIKVTADAGASVTVAVIDLDHFKHINDSFGHQAGDQVLVEFANLLTATFRSADCIARFGGEEFVLILPKANKKNAKEALYRLRESMQKHQWQLPSNEHTVTFSAGIAVSENKESKESFESLFNKADNALYHAKATGRNAIIASGDQPENANAGFIPDADLTEASNRLM